MKTNFSESVFKPDMKPKILVVDDEQSILNLLKDILTRKKECEVFQAEDYAGALAFLEHNDVDLILSDIVLGEKTGINLLETVKEKGISAPVIMITGRPGIETATESLRLGAFDYVSKPVKIESFLATVDKALQYKALLDLQRRLEEENETYRRYLEEMVKARTVDLENANKRLREEVEQRIQAEKLMRIQRDLGFTLNTVADLKEAVQLTFNAVSQIDGIDAAALYLIEDATGEIYLYHHTGISDEFVRSVSRYGPEHENFRKVSNGKTLYGMFTQLVQDVNDSKLSEGLKFVGVIPVKHENKIIASLNTASHTHDSISALSVNALETIASQLGGVIARINAETALRSSNERRAMAMEASNEGVWDYNVHSKQYYFDPRCYRILGYEPYELPQTLDTFKRLAHPDDLPEITSKVSEHFETGDTLVIEYRMKAKPGDWRWVMSKGKVFERNENGVPTKVVGTVTDITGKKAAENEILRTNLELDQIFNSTGDGICLVNTRFEIIRVNNAMVNLFDWNREQVAGKIFFDLFPDIKFEFIDHHKNRSVSSGRIIEHDFTARGPDGTELILVLTSMPLKNIENEIEGVLFNIRDVTRRVLAEKESRLKEKQLVHADRMKSLGVLVSGMAHEINNPNNFIMLNASILLKSWDDMKPILEAHFNEKGEFTLAEIPYSEMRGHIPELLGGVHEGAHRIKKIVSSLKDYARGGTADLTEDVDFNKVIKEALLLMNTPLKKHTANLSVELDSALPPIKGSFHQAEQVMINLIQNACQSLTERRQRIRIKTFHDSAANKVLVEVGDGGVGIPKENLKKIMDPFFTTKTDAGGCGLGLSICAGIIREHRGEMRIQSEPGHGTLVTLEFPAREDRV